MNTPRSQASVTIEARHIAERVDLTALDARSAVPRRYLVLYTPEKNRIVVYKSGVVVGVSLSETEWGWVYERLADGLVNVIQGRGDTETLRVKEGHEQAFVDADEGVVWVPSISEPVILAVSEILARSVVLAGYEAVVGATMEAIEPMIDLIRAGSLEGNNVNLVRQIGEALATQIRLVGRAEVGERPDLLWDHPEVERLYGKLVREYEINERDQALSRKIDTLAQAGSTIHDLLQGRRSLRVEWYIVLLIVFDVLMSLAEKLPTLW